MTKPKCGNWGGPVEKLSDAIIEAMDDIASKDYDWTIRVINDEKWLIAKLYETKNVGEIVAAKIVKQRRWSNSSYFKKD